jgi:tetratricopeptide (TPR) repeat protein
LQPPYSETNRDASAYAFAALPARFALERRDWESAAQLKPRTPATFPWQKAHDPYVAITHFARALAVSRLGRPDDATADIETLESLRVSVASANPYWAKQIEIQETAARAWQAHARGDVKLALDLMRQASALEASTEKHGVTPGDIPLAAELLGDLLFETGRFEEALEAYRSALQRAPGRYNSLFGAGQSARVAGDNSTAAAYFNELLLIADNAENHRGNIDDVRSFLKGNVVSDGNPK